MKVYLDNNILISIEQKRIDIVDLQKYFTTETQFVYSSAHIKEFLESGADYYKYENARIETIKSLTNNLYIEPFLMDIEHEFIFSIKDPKIIIDKLLLTQNLTDLIKNAVEDFNKNRIRAIKELGIDLSPLKDYPVNEIIENISQAMENKLSISLESYCNESGSCLQDKMCAIFNILDLLGFQKDKYSIKSNMARVYDALHAYYACGCDVFVSNDKRCISKTKVAYSLFKIETKIIHWDKR